jgi:Tn3 transposase DDE domain
MSDTAGYSDLVFGLYWLLGYQFGPRLADFGETRFWRTNPKADYGALNGLRTSPDQHPADRAASISGHWRASRSCWRVSPPRKSMPIARPWRRSVAVEYQW